MENVQINRAYLETLSFSDLQKLADDYSIDVPENFNRGFLIGEILEVAEESYKKNLEPDMNYGRGGRVLRRQRNAALL